MRRNRIKYLSFLILAWVFVYFYGGKVPYMLAHLVLIMPVVSFIHVIISYNTLKYSQQLKERAPMKGDKVEYSEIVVNESIIPCCYIEVKYSYNKHLTGFSSLSKNYWVGPLQRRDEKQYIYFSHRGMYEFGANEIIFTDLLGLFRLSRKIDESIKTKVLPKIYNTQISDLYNDKNQEAQIRTRRNFEDYSLFEDVRQYQYGDSMKRIHWKLSAKYRDLLTKNYSGISKNRITLLVDLKDSEGEPEEILLREDRIIESTLSVIKAFTERQEIVQVLFFDKESLNNIQISNSEEFLGIYSAIGLKEFNSKYSITDLIKCSIFENIGSGNFLIISASLDLGFLGELLQITLKGFDTNLILCEEVKNNSPEAKLIEDIRSLGVMVIDSGTILNDKGVLYFGEN